jgi:competence protein ComEC
MAEGIDWMMLVAQWVANLPGAVGRISAFGAGPLLLGSAGLIVICLLRTPLRWSGAVAMGLVALWIALTPQPDILVSADGQIAAIRRSDGRLSILKRNNDDFVVREWLAASADARPPRDATLSDGVRCDPSGCVGQLSDSALVALSIRPDAIEEDCLRAAVVVAALDIPSDCAAIAIDHMTMRAAGAVALYHNGNSFDVVRARPRGQDRPWARSVEEGSDSVQRPAGRAHPRDATPRPEDVDPTDQ